MLEGSSPLICQNTNHSFIILNRLRYVLRLPDKSYSVSTQLLCVSCRPLSVLDGTQLRLGELLLAPKGLGKKGEGVQDMWGKMWTGVGLGGVCVGGGGVSWFTSFSLSFWPVQHALSLSLTLSVCLFTRVGMKAGPGTEKTCYPLASWQC